MAVPLPLFHAVSTRISTIYTPYHVRRTSVERLALLVTGIMATKSCVLTRVAQKVDSLGLTRAGEAASVERRLRRTLGDRLLVRKAYDAFLAEVVPWDELDEITLILDESSKRSHLHLVRVSLAYRGAVIPLAWTVWRQQEPLPEGRYWQELERVLHRVQRLLPAGREVTLVADRAYDVPPLIDRLQALDWHWIIRCKGNGTVRFLDHGGTEWSLAALLDQHVPAPDHRWKARGKLFKQAGWREASVVAIWERTAEERLVVITDLPPRWEVLRRYGVRAWIEPGFRNEKSRGWQWEESQVPSLTHHHTLLLAMAWATVLTLLLGTREAETALTRVTTRRRRRATPQVPFHARYSLFSHGLQAVQYWLDRHAFRTLPEHLPHAPLITWNDHWYGTLARHYIFQSVRS